MTEIGDKVYESIEETLTDAYKELKAKSRHILRESRVGLVNKFIDNVLNSSGRYRRYRGSSYSDIIELQNTSAVKQGIHVIPKGDKIRVYMEENVPGSIEEEVEAMAYEDGRSKEDKEYKVKIEAISEKLGAPKGIEESLNKIRRSLSEIQSPDVPILVNTFIKASRENSKTIEKNIKSLSELL